MLHSLELNKDNALQKILSSFQQATGLGAFIVNEKGEGCVYPTEFPANCQFCQLVINSKQGLVKCTETYEKASREAAKRRTSHIFRCHAGLSGWATPLILENKYLGAIICAQALMLDFEKDFIKESKAVSMELGIDAKVLKKATENIAVVSPQLVQGAADILYVISNYIIKTGMLTQKTQIREETRARKLLESAFEEVEMRSNISYALDKEQKLVIKVRNGDWDGTYRVLNELLVDILQKYPNNLQEVKTRSLELLVVMSRAAVEGGANLRKLLSLNSKYMEEMIRLDSIEDLCLWLLKITQRFVDSVDEGDDIKNLQVIQKAAEYMRANYIEKLTIEDISHAVFLSPCYLSKIFKQGLGCTIMEFLTKIRIEEAKKLLRKPEYNVMQVAHRIGFEDPSYFTKVFKRNEGITPSQYKRKAL